VRRRTMQHWTTEIEEADMPDASPRSKKNGVLTKKLLLRWETRHWAAVPLPPPAFLEECVKVLRPEVRTWGGVGTLNPQPRTLNPKLGTLNP